MRRTLLIGLLALGWATGAFAQSSEYWTGPLDIQFAVVRSPGNEADEDALGRHFGAVDYNYSISSHEVTNAEYAAFLNSVSADGDPYGLWHHSAKGWPDQIHQFDNGRGGYYYQVEPGKEDNPVVRVTHRNIFRMMNWMQNGMQNDISTTDYGAYDTSQWGYDNGRYTDSLEHEANAQYWLASEDEWYKAAYFDPNRYGEGQPGYWKFPTGHEEKPDVWHEFGADPENSAIYLTGDSLPVGSVPGTLSPWGVFDMAGNAREYVAAWNTEGLPYGVAYVTRGEYWIGDGTFADTKDYRGIAFAEVNGRADWDLHSFRIVTLAVPEPTTAVSLLTAGACFIVSRRRRSF